MVAIPGKESAIIARAFLERVVGRYGCCAEVVSDGGGEFRGAFRVARGLGKFGGLSAGKAEQQTCAQTCGEGAGQGLTCGRRGLMYFHAVETKAETGGKVRQQ